MYPVLVQGPARRDASRAAPQAQLVKIRSPSLSLPLNILRGSGQPIRRSSRLPWLGGISQNFSPRKPRNGETDTPPPSFKGKGLEFHAGLQTWAIEGGCYETKRTRAPDTHHGCGSSGPALLSQHTRRLQFGGPPEG